MKYELIKNNNPCVCAKLALLIFNNLLTVWVNKCHLLWVSGVGVCLLVAY